MCINTFRKVCSIIVPHIDHEAQVWNHCRVHVGVLGRAYVHVQSCLENSGASVVPGVEFRRIEAASSANESGDSLPCGRELCVSRDDVRGRCLSFVRREHERVGS